MNDSSSISAGPSGSPALLRALEASHPQAELSPAFRAELKSLEGERDPELLWSGLLRAVERQESRAGENRLASVLTAWLATPDLSPELRARLEKKLEAAQGRGSFGSRAELLLSNFTSQAFDAKTLAPMLAAGLLGKLAQTTVLARLTASAPAWWSRGTAARSAAWAAGFGAEVSVLGASHGEFARSALSLTAMKGGLWVGTRLSLPLPVALVGATMLAYRAEASLGWRAPASFGDSLAEASAAALSFGLGFSLASRLLGPRFFELQQRLRFATSRLSENSGAAAGWARAGASLGPRLLQAEAFDGFPKPILASADPAGPRPGGDSSSPGQKTLVLPRRIPGSSGAAHPFELMLSPENSRAFSPEVQGLEGQRVAIARRDGSLLWAKVEKKELIREGDPVTPAGVTRLRLRLEEGEARGLAFLYYDSKALTLYFIDLEETMITQGRPMRPGTGSVFMTWLAEQARREGKSFHVSRITSPQTVKILRKMELIGPHCRVEACARLNPEALDEEYRVLGEFPFGDRAAWRVHHHATDFFNVFGDPGRGSEL